RRPDGHLLALARLAHHGRIRQPAIARRALRLRAPRGLPPCCRRDPPREGHRPPLSEPCARATGPPRAGRHRRERAARPRGVRTPNPMQARPRHHRPRDRADRRGGISAVPPMRPNPRRLATEAGSVIVTDPGLYVGMSNSDYHAQEAWASSTGLKALLPERYKAGGSTEALDFGTLFHTAVLEPDNLAEYVALDAEKIGLQSDGTPAQNPTMTAAWKRAVAEAEAGGRTVIAQADLDLALRMRDALLAHDVAANLIRDIAGTFEESAFAEVDGVPCRARFDKRIPGAILDLKSTSAKPGRESLTRTILDYGYDLSAAHYLAVADALGLDAQ